MSVQIPISILKKFIMLIENSLGSLVSLPDEVRDAVNMITQKAREIAATVGLEVGETSRARAAPRPPVVTETHSQSQSILSREEPIENRSTEQDTTEKRKQVKRRRRRVRHKTTKTPANEQLLHVLPVFIDNKDLKYLTTQLARGDDNEERARIYKEYLACCKFNAAFHPKGIISFDEEDARSLGVWAAQNRCETQRAQEIPQIIAKLDCAVEQKYQLTSQQATEIGKLLLAAEAVFKQNVDTSTFDRGQGRPTSVSIFEVLGNGEYLEVSESALRETTFVAMTMSNFPLLEYVNEPISHLANAVVRPSVQLLADVLQETCSVPENIATAHNNMSPYVTNAAMISVASLSQPVTLERLVPNDGDGIVELLVPPQRSDALQNDIYHRLYAIDAPELFVTHFINAGGKTLKRHNGHLSHLAVHYYIRSFGRPHGTALICKENPRHGVTPTDHYQRPISSFWFAWLESPNTEELSLLDEMVTSLRGEDDCTRARLMSSSNPRAASTVNPFFLNLNALLVLSGFCHVYTKYSPDENLLKLQKIARDNHLGSIWSGVKKNFVLGAKQHDYSSTDESIKAMAAFDHLAAERTGFPLKFHNPTSIQAVRFKERKSKRELENATRSQFREHNHRFTTLPYGFVVDLLTNISQHCSYKTVPTGEAFLQIRPSMVVGIGGSSTGRGVFTLKQIPEGTWITSYAPTAPLRLGRNHESSDFILKTVRDGSEVEIDGSLCPLGLGCIIQDGTFPFSLASEKFTSLVKARVNCEWANRDGEVWFKSTRVILAGEELLTRYSHDNSYWTTQFSTQQLQSLRHVLLASNDDSQSEAERIVRNFHL